MSMSQISTSVTIINSLLGFEAVSISGLTTSSAPTIYSGSKVEIASAFFTADSDTTINASSWTAITTATTCYICLTPSGTAGSQILTATYEDAAVWSTSKQGWYTSAGSNIRVIYSVYKTSPTEYDNKAKLPAMEENRVYDDLFIDGQISTNSNGVDRIGKASTYESNRTFRTSSSTRGAVYAALSPYLINVDDSMSISGARGSGTNLYIASHATRTAVDTIAIYYVSYGSGITFISYQDSSATAVGDLSIAW